MAAPKKTTALLKEREEQIVSLNAKIRELTEENKQLKANNREIDLSELENTAVNVRFCTDEKAFVLDKIAYSKSGIASLVSTELVAQRGHAEMVQFGERKIKEYVEQVMVPRLVTELQESK